MVSFHQSVLLLYVWCISEQAALYCNFSKTGRSGKPQAQMVSHASVKRPVLTNWLLSLHTLWDLCEVLSCYKCSTVVQFPLMFTWQEQLQAYFLLNGGPKFLCKTNDGPPKSRSQASCWVHCCLFNWAHILLNEAVMVLLHPVPHHFWWHLLFYANILVLVLELQIHSANIQYTSTNWMNTTLASLPVQLKEAVMAAVFGEGSDWKDSWKGTGNKQIPITLWRLSGLI